MCSIIGSFVTEKVIELIDLNRYRGEYSHSISLYDFESQEFQFCIRKLGPINIKDLPKAQGEQYIIVHMQAPTTASRDDSIHPAQYEDNYLWHNGILKPETIVRLQLEFKTTEQWDSLLLLKYLCAHNMPLNIDGTFACVLCDGNRIYLFRNEIAPLFIDDEFNISSTKFINSKSIEPNIMYNFGPNLYPIGAFNTVNNPYFFE